MITVYGADGTTHDQLRLLDPPTRPDNAGKRWKPLPHADLVDAVKDEITTRGWRVLDEQYALARDGADLAGALGVEIRGSDGATTGSLPAGMSFAIGFLHSNARRRALRLTVGATVACCNNGMCSGQILCRRLHTSGLDLYQEVEDAVDQYTLAASNVRREVSGLRQQPLSQDWADRILMRAARAGLVAWSTLGKVDREYRNPTFAEHGRDTSWALLNAFTYAARENIAPTRQMEAYNKFQQLLPQATVAA